MKIQLITKESISKKENLKAIKLKIEELKKEFKKRKYNHVGQLYEILNEIVRLKQAENPRYAPRSLEWEEGINLKGSEIRYIFAYQYISEYAREKVLEGLIDDNTICHLLATSALLREPQWQNRMIDKLINQEIKVSGVSELTKDEIKKVILGKLKVREDDNYFLAATKSLRNMKKRIEDRKHLLKKSVYRDNLVNAIKELNKVLKYA